MYLDRSKILSFFFFSLSCRRSRGREAGSAVGPLATRPAGPASPTSPAARSPPSCCVAPLYAGASVAPFEPFCLARMRRTCKALARRGLPLRGVAGKHLATPAAGTDRHGGCGDGGVAPGSLRPLRGPGEGCASFVGPTGCRDPAPGSLARRSYGPGPAWGVPLGPAAPARAARGPRAPP